MIARLSILAPCLAAVALLASCGAPGIPEPPSLELARPVRDLRALRKGNQVHLSWSVPTQTTDHHTFRHSGPTRICRSLGALHDCENPLIELPTETVAALHRRGLRLGRRPAGPAPPSPDAGYTDQLSPGTQTQSPGMNLVYAVSVFNSYGRTAGLSNEVQVPSAPTLPPPQGVSARLTAEGVTISWSAVSPSENIPGLRYFYRVYRLESATNKNSVAGELSLTDSSHPALLDKTFEWEKSYDYRVTVVTEIERPAGLEQVEGDDSAPVHVIAHDVFPPAVPAGLQAAFSGPGQKPFIDLVWVPDTEADLAGYNVYRRQAGSEPVKLNRELVKAPAFRDSDVTPGLTYFYSVSAIDLRGNESSRSAEQSQTVPSPDQANP